jgi:hypothetical protein
LRRTAPSDCRIAQRSAQGRLESLTRAFSRVYTRGYEGAGAGVRARREEIGWRQSNGRRKVSL